MQFSADGQILTVSTSGGFVFNFLMNVPSVSGHYGQKIASLTSLRTVSVYDTAADDPTSEVCSVNTAIEPSFIALGPKHVCVGMNNHAFFYDCTPGSTALVQEQEYMGSVKQLLMNATYAAVLCDGQIQLHSLAPSQKGGDREHRSFPDSDDTAKVTGMSLTSDFLVYGTDKGTLHHFYLTDWALVNEFRHSLGIISLSANHLGTRVLLVDAGHQAWLYSPVDDSKIEVADLPPTVEAVLWDQQDSSVFAAVDARSVSKVYTYACHAQTTKGATVARIGTSKVPVGYKAVLLHEGTLQGLRSSGQVGGITLASHDALSARALEQARSSEKLRNSVLQLMALNRLKAAWELSLQIKSKEVWQQLANKALENLDVDLATMVYRELKNASMVVSLEPLRHIEDKHLLAGCVCVLNSEFNKAQNMFLNSSSPAMALQMRRDLLHWDHALKLAKNFAPAEIPDICREYGSQLEIRSEYSQALAMFQRGLVPEVPNQTLTEEHIRACNAGVARMALRLGELAKGLQMATTSNDKNLMKDAGAILESMKQYAEAADLFVMCEMYERAVGIYLAHKLYAKAGPLVAKITSPKLLVQYGKMREADRHFQEAADAYERAKDLDSVVRLNLYNLDNPERAFQLVRETKSVEGANLVVDYCNCVGDPRSAVAFLLIAKRGEEAFQLAQAHDAMESYVKALGDEGGTDEYLNIALYYESIKNWAKAGRFYMLCRHWAKAIKHFIQCGDACIDEAIQVVKQAHGQPGSELLVRTLLDLLLGETDGVVKDPNHVFRLYMAIGDYPKAASTALIIANDEQQKLGNYKNAHSILFETARDLQRSRIPVPDELRRSLLLLHSYIIVKKLMGSGDHNGAARMLMRVAQSISRFPLHVVPLLTSTVIECQRAGLKRSAYEYASMLMRPEYRNSVNKKYRKPIETIVRRPDQTEEEEPVAACPVCEFPVPETLLDCPGCKNTIPYCVTTGKHMTIDDWAFCPSCAFPTLFSAFTSGQGPSCVCSMCDNAVDTAAVVRLDPAAVRAFLTNTDGGAAGRAAAAEEGADAVDDEEQDS